MREIFIRRHEISSFLPPDIVSTGMQRIGSVLKGNTPLRGLSFEDERKYLPSIIGVSADSADFTKAATAYWAQLSIPVPIDGFKLNLTLDDKGEPLHYEDYVKYQWCLRHPHVERSKSSAEGSFKARFYLYDPDKEVERKNKRTRQELAATAELTKIIQGANTKDTLARLTRVLVSQNPARMTVEQMENDLMEVAKRDPERFLSVATDKRLELQDLTIQLTESNVVQKIGEQYRYNDDTIAGSRDEFIAFLDNKQNTRILGEMKAKLEEAQKFEVA